MKTVNALTLRNSLGQVLATLEKDGEPILISKGKVIRAVLITLEDFQRRFIDKQAEDKKRELLDRIRSLNEKRVINRDSVTLLRELRGYEE